MAKVALIMGSQSDFETVSGCVKVLKKFGVECEARVMSAHRTPREAATFAENARANGFDVIICAAGKAAHLAGSMAAYTTLPIIGIPIKSSTLDGMDALLSIVQMPPGIPVATVAIDGAVNAALLAIQMISLKDDSMIEKLDRYRKGMVEAVVASDAEIIEKAKALN